MKKRFLTIVLLASLFSVGCFNPNTTKGPIIPEAGKSTSVASGENDQKLSLASVISNVLRSNAKINEIDKPTLKLLSDIDASQIVKYFQLGDLRFALVLRSSMNVTLKMPAGFTPSFSGVLVAQRGEGAWKKWIGIRDGNPSDKNNPYYLWVDDEKLLLSVVDQNGAGSGEGVMKVFVLSEKGFLKLDGCFYFGGHYGGTGQDGDYFAFSSKVSEQDPPQRTLSDCDKDVILTSNDESLVINY